MTPLKFNMYTFTSCCVLEAVPPPSSPPPPPPPRPTFYPRVLKDSPTSPPPPVHALPLSTLHCPLFAYPPPPSSSPRPPPPLILPPPSPYPLPPAPPPPPPPLSYPIMPRALTYRDDIIQIDPLEGATDETLTGVDFSAEVALWFKT